MLDLRFHRGDYKECILLDGSERTIESKIKKQPKNSGEWVS
jgi:hypothetical protein